ncbi:GlsB/YeaQ/YmgE family stress response membrane protein [Cardiobacteriaceae bacterium TAE3-ERU3]|nr:GlsB/YeaQ/YmgE family stress response membrane protein [Cardiobacteriaceae bacterium TAE3-ERU3]
MINFIIWLILGAIAGWLAGQIVKGHGFGAIGNIVVGIVGAFIGGFLANYTGIGGEATGLNIGSIVTATVGAVVLLFLIGLIKRG